MRIMLTNQNCPFKLARVVSLAWLVVRDHHPLLYSMDENFLNYAVRMSLADMLDKRVVLVLRGTTSDDETYIGHFRSFDQFYNIVLENTVYRTFVENGAFYYDSSRGMQVFRGENVFLMAEVDTKTMEGNPAKPLSKAEFYSHTEYRTEPKLGI